MGAQVVKNKLYAAGKVPPVRCALPRPDLTSKGYLPQGRTVSGQLEIQRRKELQASCLGAAFLGANKRAFRLTGARLAIWQDIVHHVGDEYGKVRDHGSRKNHAYWTIQAFNTTNPSVCNTFTAPSKRVS
ncbi:hypothetical protein AB0L70_15480 [Kribbella sp. NPDC051952]|uniref:hypothetical protein n=1 Tax=Kribbella sp. NPDC051952 TaxID=3154851 RepID=UPI00341FBE5E